MTVKELISELLNYPMDSTVVVKKELAYNIWVNSEIKIKKKMKQQFSVLIFPVKNLKLEENKNAVTPHFFYKNPLTKSP